MSEDLKPNLAVLAYRKHFRAHIQPKYYIWYIHVLFNFTVLIGASGYFLSRVSVETIWHWVCFPIGLLIGNAAVYFIHKFLLHRKRGWIWKKTFLPHSQYHHNFYTHECPVYDSPQDFCVLFFSPLIVSAFAFVFLPLNWWIWKWVLPENAVNILLFTFSFYFLLYEVFHYVSHLPENHWTQFFFPFRFMRRHHLMHHNPKYMREYNFNIVFPLFDHLLKTYKS